LFNKIKLRKGGFSSKKCWNYTKFQS